MTGILSVDEASVTVELLGLARHRAGRAELHIPGGTLADTLRSVGRECPGLEGLVNPDGSLSRRFLFSLDGERFLDDAAVPVPAGARLLILGADAGG